MRVIIYRTEKKLLKIMRHNLLSSEKDIEEFLKQEKLIENFVLERFNGNCNKLAKLIYDAIKLFPNLLVEGNKIKVVLNPEEIIKRISPIAQISQYERNLEVVTFISGFDSAQCAYRNTIYYGIEWFVPPENIGMRKNNPIYRYLKELSQNPTKYIIGSIIHEFMHIAAPKVEGRSKLFTHLIEEGRACYITHLLNPELKLSDVLYMRDHEIEWCDRNLSILIKDLAKYVEKDDVNDEILASYFSPSKKLYGISRTGYFLGYFLVKKLTESMGRNKKIEYLLTPNLYIKFTNLVNFLSEDAKY